MIKKARQKPIKLLAQEALLRRLCKSHPKYPIVENDYKRSLAGYIGEQNLDFFLTFLPNERYFILHGLRLGDPKERYFQMDTLLLTTTHCLILESKNISGELEFDYQNNQLIRTTGDKKESISDPITQVERQKFQLESWLLHHNYPNYPVASQVVITNTHSLLKKNTPAILKKVTRHINLPSRMKRIDDLYTEDVLQMKDLRKLAKIFIKKHTPEAFSALAYYKIPLSAINTGVICSECSHHPMIRKRGKWFCSNCRSSSSKSAHIEAMKDYFLLISSTITNRELREFLHLSSSSTASKILTSLNLPFTGENKGRKYFLNEGFLQYNGEF